MAIEHLSQSNDRLAHETCRLCGGQVTELFCEKVLDRYPVRYLRCAACGSAQTETPYWLDEAYRNHLARTDTGAAQRNIHNMAACYFIGRLFGLKTGVDIGGSDGLLCRLLRDHGMDYYVQDKYASPTYAQGFTEPPFATPDMVSSFEVLEHFANPQTDLEMLFQFRSPVLLATTAIYENQPQGWWYYAPHSGQHVFFYSRKALEKIAEDRGYGIVLSGGFILFGRKELLTPVKRFLAMTMLRGKVGKLLSAVLVLLPASGSWRDMLSLQAAAHEKASLEYRGDAPTVLP